PYSKTIFLLGTLPHPSSGEHAPVDALLIVEKLHFSASEIAQFTQRRLGDTESIGENDVYHWLKGRFNRAASPAATLTAIYPATEAHILKYTYQERRMIRETPEAYASVVVPYMQGLSPARIQWVYNVLDGISEQERILYRDHDPHTGFVLMPDRQVVDHKWDGQTMESMYLLTLCEDRSIRLLRDLRAHHLPLLRNMRRKIAKVVNERFGVPAHQLRLFFHYQPTYYHLHVHVTHVRNDKLGGMAVGQSYLLDNVISTLECMDNYYERCTITYALGVNHPLYAAFEKHHAVVPLDDDDAMDNEQ
ncbi:scavenger mRNA decapping enzyme, partial [Syncephalis pseudoplumigaleata]